jgi:hypothetical protein
MECSESLRFSCLLCRCCPGESLQGCDRTVRIFESGVTERESYVNEEQQLRDTRHTALESNFGRINPHDLLIKVWLDIENSHES